MTIVGCNVRCYPSQHGDYVEYKVVLTIGDIGDYAAYAGSGTNEWVADHGDKISFAEARIHFPGLPKETNYRE